MKPVKSLINSRPVLGSIETVDMLRSIPLYDQIVPVLVMSPVRVASMQLRFPLPVSCSGSWPMATYTRFFQNTGVAMISLGPPGEGYWIGLPSLNLYSGGLQSYFQTVFK